MDTKVIYNVIKVGEENEPFISEVSTALKKLWADLGVQEAYDRRNEYQLSDGAKYFLDSIDRISEKNYQVSEQDILHTRVKTTGIVEISFLLRNLKFRVFDVGGQRSERKKWIYCFEDVNAVIFITAMSEYNLVLSEDHTVNRMVESVHLFESICNSRWFLKTSMILFLNKKDLFAEKVEKHPLTIAFPHYDGPQTYDACASHIQNEFEAVNNSPDKTIFTHQTCATDTNQVQFVLNACINLIIQRNLQGCGLQE